jgi:hypothetical protein
VIRFAIPPCACYDRRRDEVGLGEVERIATYRPDLMETALIGFVGVLLGIFINEMLRRRNRIESYAGHVFDKRLEIYEGLYQRVAALGPLATDLIENSNYSHEQRHQIVSVAVQDIAGWCDDNDMYINEELTVHCVPLLMGIEDVYDMKDEASKQATIAHFRENFRAAKKMIRKEAGIEDIEKLFSRITKPRRSSPIVEAYREEKQRQGAKGKFD